MNKESHDPCEKALTPAQARIVKRFQRLVRDAKAADLVLAVDAHAWALRFIPREVEQAADDLCTVGEAVTFPDVPCDLTRGEGVSVDSACGTRVCGHGVM